MNHLSLFRSELSLRLIFCIAFVACSALLTLHAHGAAKSEAPGPDQLPSIKELPDPFLLEDGSRVLTPKQWQQHRAKLKELILAYEYGHLPPAGQVKADEQSSKQIDNATEHDITLHVGPQAQVPVKMVLTTPAGKGPFPVILKGDLCWGRVDPKIVQEV